MTLLLVMCCLLVSFHGSMSLLTYAALTAIDALQDDKEEHLIIVLFSIVWPLGLGLILAEIYDADRKKPRLKTGL